VSAFGLGITVGRTENNDIQVSDPSVSRFQGYFQLNPRTGGWTFTDAGSTNGTFLNGKRLAPSKPEPLGGSAPLSFGNVVMRFYVPAEFFRFLDEMANR
jgi:pSer/pThr/pTyr-binding forkhead associated (FHA) protein